RGLYTACRQTLQLGGETMLTFRELEHIAETILKHTTPEEMQCYLDMEHDSKLLWIKYKIASLEVQA
ncbi:hypothetical protein MKK29_11000, partial [Streptococcus suis]|nr:hypothetical protein [Streptococcus suis]